MNKKSLLKVLFQICSLFPFVSHASGLIPADSLYSATPEYKYLIDAYHSLDSSYSKARLIPYGKTDVGIPLELFIIDKKGIFDPKRLHELGVTILFINNGIHPGEPDGVNASLIWAEQLLKKIDETTELENVAVCILPMYNIDGALNRNCCGRVNQDGPPLYGFRGNAQNLDLNRDFIKCDARNTQSLIAILKQWDPDIFLDTHVSDGADYQYTMTLVSSQSDKLYPTLGNYMKKTLSPLLYKKMKQKGEEMCPYVDTKNYEDSPDEGIRSFLELPRFSTGYNALFNTYGFIAETHMLKPFKRRVESTVTLLQTMLEVASSEGRMIRETRSLAKKEDVERKLFPINWQVDTNYSEMIDFKGYTASFKTSTVTGLPQLYYNHSKPYEKKIPLYSKYYAEDTIVAPMYYFIPQAWMKVLTLLEQNKIRLIPVKEDSTTIAEVTYITDFRTSDSPYEGHYLHSDTKIKRQQEEVKIMKGDYLVPVFQENSRFIIETLEPVSVDSYFNWGFFDGILQQKEWFSGYVFEPIAEKILNENPELKKDFELKKATDSSFARDAFNQLYYIYQHSSYFEKSYHRYPVVRIGTR